MGRAPDFFSILAHLRSRVKRSHSRLPFCNCKYIMKVPADIRPPDSPTGKAPHRRSVGAAFPCRRPTCIRRRPVLAGIGRNFHQPCESNTAGTDLPEVIAIHAKTVRPVSAESRKHLGCIGQKPDASAENPKASAGKQKSRRNGTATAQPPTVSAGKQIFRNGAKRCRI